VTNLTWTKSLPK